MLKEGMEQLGPGSLWPGCRGSEQDTVCGVGLELALKLPSQTCLPNTSVVTCP